MDKDCPGDPWQCFTKRVGERLRGQIFRVNALMVVMGILMGFMVGIGTYGHRYRHIPLIRFLFLAATTLFLPIVSYIVSSSDLDNYKSTTIWTETIVVVNCSAGAHIIYVLIWTALVLNVGINTTALVAADAREGRSIPPNMTLLIQAMWTSYLGIHICIIQEKPCGYQLKSMSYRLRDDMYHKGLVTFDKVWQLNDTLLRSKSPQLKELCFSFALFKLLRCRIARYTITEVGFIKGSNFLRQILLEDNDGERVLAVIAHELSFLHDYYYSSLPIIYSKSWLPIVSGSISLVSICYCLLAIIFIAAQGNVSEIGQIICDAYGNAFSNSDADSISFGSIYFDIIPLYILAALVILAEVRDIAFYIRSNWMKVALICQYVKHGSWRQSATIQRCVGCVLRSKGKLIRNWEDKMGQSLILVLHPSKTPMALLRHLIHLSGQNTKIPSAVKSAIVGALRKCYETGQINGDVPSFQRILHLQGDDKIIWTFGERGTAEIMLVCHIATTILGARLPTHQPPSDTDHISAANHISQYCAYLVAHYPELLPEDAEWCKSLYKAVEKDAKRVLIGNDSRESWMSEVEYRRRLIQLLSAERNHEVLKDGARLAEQLAEEGEEAAWKALAAFWSEMILYVAPSDNIDGHMKAIARGGELITLLWALVTHLGIVGRSDNTTDAATVDV
ncbi:unnamed protein product [Triticum turgidum subsp. durum]|uniref:DUF4220 domain-containing protein n=1 Tax=Triticum turgidum subsp. durum TaxID=4567 RepID=A0A9R0YZ92_TRITD|nr:unnamed protein product [Triticum turgidum subsp. durum]